VRERERGMSERKRERERERESGVKVHAAEHCIHLRQSAITCYFISCFINVHFALSSFVSHHFFISLLSALLTGSGFKTFQPYYAITSGMTQRQTRAPSTVAVAQLQFTFHYIIEANIRIIGIIHTPLCRLAKQYEKCTENKGKY